MTRSKWGDWCLTRDKAGHWVAAELIDEDMGDVAGTVTCRRVLHRLRIPDDAPRWEAAMEAQAASMLPYYSVLPSPAQTWSAEDERLAADRSLTHRQVAEATGRTPRAVASKRCRMGGYHYAQEYGYRERK